MASKYKLEKINASEFNKWQMERHYLKRPIIRTKMLAHGIFIDSKLVGGLLWVTPHFTKKKNLFGYPNTFDKWEVLVLGRFYLEDNTELIASSIMSDSIGRGHHRGSKRRGWRIQRDWVIENPPVNPENPFVPRLLISWSDTEWGHNGTIYKASGWELFDVTNSSGQRTKNFSKALKGNKKCWILYLQENKRVQKLGCKLSPIQEQLL